ncbi:hypothetical protein TNCT_348521 [Trichonephila clavata]|uniref:Uncharacterized protein n=1 Tax=Trichonephila clavata TaxID=2740835 RepID=A0A8X6LJR9_TRICU|nr:hypothetical protein TNCT_348521 [Trichonephila clavata]
MAFRLESMDLIFPVHLFFSRKHILPVAVGNLIEYFVLDESVSQILYQVSIQGMNVVILKYSSFDVVCGFAQDFCRDVTLGA